MVVLLLLLRNEGRAGAVPDARAEGDRLQVRQAGVSRAYRGGSELHGGAGDDSWPYIYA